MHSFIKHCLEHSNNKPLYHTALNPQTATWNTPATGNFMWKQPILPFPPPLFISSSTQNKQKQQQLHQMPYMYIQPTIFPYPPKYIFLNNQQPPSPPTLPPPPTKKKHNSTTHTKQPNSSDLEVAGDRDGDCSLSPVVTLFMWPGPQRSAQLRQRILRDAIDVECSNPRAVHVVVKLQTVLRAAGIVVHLKHATTCQQRFFP